MRLNVGDVDLLKKAMVEPPPTVPYRISVCLARSSTVSIGVTNFSTVKKAARLAVYDETRIKLKNHQALVTTRPRKKCFI
jgi:hypothetical protein